MKKKSIIVCLVIFAFIVSGFFIIRPNLSTSEVKLFNEMINIVDLDISEDEANALISESYSTMRKDKYESEGVINCVYSVNGNDINLLCDDEIVYSYIISNIHVQGSYNYCKSGYFDRVVKNLRNLYGQEELLNDNDYVTSCLFYPTINSKDYVIYYHVLPREGYPEYSGFWGWIMNRLLPTAEASSIIQVMTREKFEELYPGEEKYNLDPTDSSVLVETNHVVQSYVAEHIGPISQKATLELTSIFSTDALSSMGLDYVVEYAKEYFDIDNYDIGESILDDSSIYQTVVTFREVDSFYGYDIDLTFDKDNLLFTVIAYYNKVATGNDFGSHENGALDIELTNKISDELPIETEKYDIEKYMSENYGEPRPTESGSTATIGSFICYRLVVTLGDCDVFFYLEDNRLKSVEVYTVAE